VTSIRKIVTTFSVLEIQEMLKSLKFPKFLTLIILKFEQSTSNNQNPETIFLIAELTNYECHPIIHFSFKKSDGGTGYKFQLWWTWSRWKDVRLTGGSNYRVFVLMQNPRCPAYALYEDDMGEDEMSMQRFLRSTLHL